MTTLRIPLSRALAVASMMAGVAVSSADARADEPVLAADAVVITNTSGAPWKGVSVNQGGASLCTVELAPGSTLVVVNQICQVSSTNNLGVTKRPIGGAGRAAPAAEVDLLGDEDDLLAGEVLPGVAPAAPRQESSQLLVGHTTISAGFGPARRVGIFNDSDTAWSGCSVVLNGEWSYTGPTWLDPGEHEGIMGQRFVNGTGDFMVQNHVIHTVRVSCNEGTGTFVPM